MRKKFLIGIILLVVSLSLIACSDSEETTNNVVQTQESAELETEKELKSYYEANEAINQFINNYNAANPNTKIEKGTFEAYYHHGQTHDNQIIMHQEDFEIVISDNYDLEVVINGGTGENDAYKELFKQYAKGYDLDLTDEKLDNYWEQILNNTIPTGEFEEFECYLQMHNETISLMELSGEIQ